MKVQNILDESYGDCRHKEDKRMQLFVMKSKRSLQFTGLFVWSCNKLAIPKPRKNAEGFVMKRRLKGAHCQHWHCLPIVACNDLLGSVQKRQDKARREERSRTNYANCRLSCSTLIPASKMTRPKFLRVRVLLIQRCAAWNRRTSAAFHYLRCGLVIIQPIIPM